MNQNMEGDACSIIVKVVGEGVEILHNLERLKIEWWLRRKQGIFVIGVDIENGMAAQKLWQ